jgi:phage host-nuclease inhibitor protein Gam
MPSWGGGGVDMSGNFPTAPWPSGFEVVDVYLAAANENPYTAEQQIQDWGNRHRELSVSVPNMQQATAQAWTAFLLSLNGIVNVFQFPGAICTKYPVELTNSGTPKYFRLKSNDVKWTIRPGSIYKNLTFEVREAL